MKHLWVLWGLFFSLLTVHSAIAEPTFYITSRSNSGLYKISGSNSATRIDYLSNVDFASVSGFGNTQLLVTDLSSNKIHIFNPDGTVSQSLQAAYRPESAIKDNTTGDILYADYQNHSVRRINVNTGNDTLAWQISSNNAGMYVAQRSSGLVYMTDWHNIYQASNDAQIATSDQPRFLISDAQNLYFGNLNSHSIYKIDSANNVSLFWSDPSGTICIYAMSYDQASGNFFALGQTAGQTLFNIYRFTADGSISLYLQDIANLPPPNESSFWAGQ